MSNVEVIDKHLNGHGQVIVEEAASEGLSLHEACALVEQESNGRNIFGCDHGNTGGRPPYCGEAVTKERVATLRAHPLANGVGLTQLTYDPFVGMADAEGGAHLPRYQCRIGFRLLADYLAKYPKLEAYGAYNAGEGNRWLGISNGYAGSVNDKALQWKSMLEEEEEEEYPERRIAFSGRWGYDLQTGAWIRSDANLALLTDSRGWLAKVGEEAFAWPEANEPVVWNRGWIGRHPTRYTWREDIEGWARYLVKNFNVWCNTYVDHPEGWGRDTTSIDVWGPAGRGNPIDPVVGQAVFDLLFNDPGLPNIDWTIWEGWIWTANGGWKWFVDDGTGLHYDHIHFTWF